VKMWILPFLLLLCSAHGKIILTLFEEDMAVVCWMKLGQQSGATNVVRSGYQSVSFDVKPAATALLDVCNGIFMVELIPDSLTDSNTTLTFSDQKSCLVALARISSSRIWNSEFSARFNCYAAQPNIVYTMTAPPATPSETLLISQPGFPLYSVSVSVNGSGQANGPPIPDFGRCAGLPLIFGFPTQKAASNCQEWVLQQPNVISVACLADYVINGVWYVTIQLGGSAGWAHTLNMTQCLDLTYVAVSPVEEYQRTFIWDFGAIQQCREALYSLSAIDQYNNSTMELCLNEYQSESSSMVFEFNAVSTANQTLFAALTSAPTSSTPFAIQALTITYPIAYP